MGGGGGNSSNSLGDTRQLEERAKEILRAGESGRKNVFISFAFEDLDEVNLLRGQAKSERSEIEFNDWSIREPFDSERADYIRQKLRERINQCSTTVVFLSGDTARSEWVRWEVEKSLELGKRVIATHSGSSAPTVIPSFVQDNKIDTVPWANLASALKEN